MQTRVRFGQLGSAHGQFNSPHGFCLGIDEDIVVADTNNHRIQVMINDGVDFNWAKNAVMTKR
jgi:NHL repeat